MSKPYIHYGWHLSYFSGKTRCYLEYKGIPYKEKPINLYTLMVTAPRKTGASVMPILVTPEGEWVQDTSVIIDRLEADFPSIPVVPGTPVQRMAAYLLEFWGDEWWVPIAMHTRWSHPENYPLFEREAGDNLLPGAPRFIKNRLAAKIANQMRSYQETVGFVPEQHSVMDQWTEAMLDHLERHFSQLPFLLGSKPSLADFGLVGSMYGHLGRDPWPKQHLIAPRPHLRGWIDRMAQPSRANSGDWLANDQIPTSLTPVFKAIASEFLPMLEGILSEVRKFMVAKPERSRLPRGLGFIEFPMGQGRFRRMALPYSLWMLQRMQRVYQGLQATDQQHAKAWLSSIGAERLLEMQLPAMERHGMNVVLVGQEPRSQVHS